MLLLDLFGLFFHLRLSAVGADPVIGHFFELETVLVGDMVALVAADYIPAILTDHAVLVPFTRLRYLFRPRDFI